MVAIKNYLCVLFAHSVTVTKDNAYGDMVLSLTHFAMNLLFTINLSEN